MLVSNFGYCILTGNYDQYLSADLNKIRLPQGNIRCFYKKAFLLLSLSFLQILIIISNYL